jgi:hypothetical protein
MTTCVNACSTPPATARPRVSRSWLSCPTRCGGRRWRPAPLLASHPAAITPQVQLGSVTEPETTTVNGHQEERMSTSTVVDPHRYTAPAKQ